MLAFLILLGAAGLVEVLAGIVVFSSAPKVFPGGAGSVFHEMEALLLVGLGLMQATLGFGFASISEKLSVGFVAGQAPKERDDAISAVSVEEDVVDSVSPWAPVITEARKRGWITETSELGLTLKHASGAEVRMRTPADGLTYFNLPGAPSPQEMRKQSAM